MTTLADLTGAQQAALRINFGRTLHLTRTGYCYSLAGPYVRRATAQALVAKKLARLQFLGTSLQLTPKGRRVAQALAEEGRP